LTNHESKGNIESMHKLKIDAASFSLSAGQKSE
jgi:hypothetical protein